MAERHQEFFFTKELREQLTIPKPLLLKLGKAGLLFAQAETPRHDNYTLFRYHLAYAQGAVRQLDLNLRGEALAAQFTDYAADQTDLMAQAMNRYYQQLFDVPADQVRPDGQPYLYRDQAAAAIGLSDPKTNNYADTYIAPGRRPTWNPQRLAEVFDWVIPGSPETVQRVQSGLGGLALGHVRIAHLDASMGT